MYGCEARPGEDDRESESGETPSPLLAYGVDAQTTYRVHAQAVRERELYTSAHSVESYRDSECTVCSVPRRTMSHSAAPWDTSHWLSVRALVRLILIENGCRSKE